ncbi:MAG: fibronectin type III domain-containing protein [Bacteroidales bacterium]|nr:fibronectin type III domain-containing protein [Bacteroidales bacterium]
MKRIQFLLFTLLFCFLVGTAYAQDRRTFPNSETYVETVLDATTLNALSQEFSIDRVQRNTDGTFNTRIWLSNKDYDNFLAREIPYSVVQPTRATVTMATNYAEMVNGWNRYPTYSTYLAMMDTFQTRYPNLCKIDTILASTPGGRKVLCAHISNNLNDNMGKPAIFYTSTMHGDEVVGYYFMLRLIDMLLSNYNTNTRLTNMVNNFDIWICPLHNPDGTYHTSDNQINISPTSTRANYNGVDLNRSFPQAEGTIGSGYEPEVSAMMQFFDEHNFTLAANFHGGAEVFNYPWDAWRTSTRAHADDAWWQYIGRKFADTCHTYSSSYFTEENNGITEGGDWYVITGSMQDYHNWFLGTRHVTIEVGDKVLSTSSLPSYWNYAYHSLLNLIEESGYGIHGTVTDSLTGEPLQAMVYVNNHDAYHSYVETALPYGTYHRPIKGGQYSVTYSAEGYNSKTITVNVTDGAKLTKNVQLVSTDTNSCKKPKYVTVNYNGGTSAVVSWSSTAQSCNIKLNNTLISNVTSPYTLTNLASSTHYDVQVQADCGDGDLSDWTDAVGFTTDCLAQDRCDITFELTDSYGDGWNGAAIQVVDEASNEVLGTFSNTNAADANETQTYTLSVCNGRAIKFVWVNGSYNSECSYSILDVFGDVIVSGNGAMTTTNYTVDCGLSACPKPNNLVITETTGTTATLSWTENGTANAWQICLNGDETNLINVTANPYTLTGLTAEAAYTAKVRANCGDEQSNWSNVVSFVPSDKVTIGSGTSTSNCLPLHNYYNYSLTQQIYTTEELGEAGDILSIDFYKNNTIQCNRDLDIYMVSTTKSSFSSSSDWIQVSAANKVFSGTVSFADNDWTTITLDTPFEYDGTRNVAIIVDDNTGSYKSNTSFLTYTVSSNQAHYSYQDGSNIDTSSPSASNNSCVTSKNQIRVLIDREPSCPAPTDVAVSVTGRRSAVVNWTENGEATSWMVAYRSATENRFTEVEVSENTYTMTGLSIETSYVVKVRPVCDNVTDSWSDEMTFTTEGCYTISPDAQESGKWTENFEGYTNVTTSETGVQPDCWEVLVPDVALTASTMPQLYHGFATSGSYSLRMKNRCLYAMPSLDEEVPVNALRMTFNLRQPNAIYRLQVGVVNENGEFTVVKTINNASTGKEPVTVDFTDYNGDGHRIAFRNTLKSGSTLAYSYNYIDDIEIGYANSCEIAVLPYTENFDSYTTTTATETGVQPSCWEVITEDVSLTESTMPQLYRGYATSGSYSLRMKNRCVYAMKPLSENINVGSLTMTFNLRQPKSIYRLQVGVLNENGEFTVVKTLKCSNTSNMEAKTVNFSNYTGNGHRIAFRNTLVPGTGMSTTYLDYSVNYIDDINLDNTVQGKGVANVIDMDADLENIEVYPNPTTGLLHIGAEDVLKVECYSMMGQIVGVYDNVRDIDISSLSKGVYTLRITMPQGVAMRKVVKR